MTNDPHVLFWALTKAIKIKTNEPVAYNEIRTCVKEYLGIYGMRLADKVLLETLRRRLDVSPHDTPPDVKRKINAEVAKFFGDNEDLFKV